jgi:hypothetical protein
VDHRDLSVFLKRKSRKAIENHHVWVCWIVKAFVNGPFSINYWSRTTLNS